MRPIIIITILTILISKLILGQDINRNKLTEELINTIFDNDTISNKIFDFPVKIFNYEFEGVYSPELLFPETFKTDSSGKIISAYLCADLIQFEKPIWLVLKNIDPNYDSIFYQEQIINLDQTFWSNREIKPNNKLKFINRKWRNLYREINGISTPIFSKKGDIAMVKYILFNGKADRVKGDRFLIFKKVGNDWELITTIKSINNWATK